MIGVNVGAGPDGPLELCPGVVRLNGILADGGNVIPEVLGLCRVDVSVDDGRAAANDAAISMRRGRARFTAAMGWPEYGRRP